MMHSGFLLPQNLFAGIDLRQNLFVGDWRVLEQDERSEQILQTDISYLKVAGWCRLHQWTTPEFRLLFAILTGDYAHRSEGRRLTVSSLNPFSPRAMNAPQRAPPLRRQHQ
jgi:hypothetical protein